MQIPLQINFHDMDPSPAVEEAVRERATKLEAFHHAISGCRVTIEAPHRRHHQGNVFHVRIVLRVPGREIIVSRDPAEHHAHEDVYVAIRDAFDAARRQLEDHAREVRGQSKQHETAPVGRVVKLFPDKGYGFIETSSGHEVYFHQNSVANGAFPRLRLGEEVRFSEELGAEGAQAIAVHLV